MQQTSTILVKLFSILNDAGVQCLLIGGQACVIYGAKTSTVDLDITILSTNKNLTKLKNALEVLEAKASPASVPLDATLLARGHSLHYYCGKSGFDNIRFDILGTLPRLQAFSNLWQRRFDFVSDSGVTIPVLSIPDLILSKKTGRIKDAADITALVNAHYIMNHLEPDENDVRLWLTEAREVDVLQMFVEKFPRATRQLTKARPLLAHVLTEDIAALKSALIAEATDEAVRHETFRGPLRSEARDLARLKRRK